MHSNVDIMNMELKTAGERGIPMELDVISLDAHDYDFKYLHGFVDDSFMIFICYHCRQMKSF